MKEPVRPYLKREQPKSTGSVLTVALKNSPIILQVVYIKMMGTMI